MMTTDNYLTLIYEGCLRNERKYQELLYKLLASRMLGVCIRYAKDKDEAQDILQEGFVKLFTHLHSYRGEGSLEGWMRRIMVYSAISRYRKARTMVLVGDFDEDDHIIAGKAYNSNTLEVDDILKLIQQLPETYRAVFNMYAIEGYPHKEISKSLGMTEIMSRTTLSRARTMLKNRMYDVESRELHRIAV